MRERWRGPPPPPLAFYGRFSSVHGEVVHGEVVMERKKEEEKKRGYVLVCTYIHTCTRAFRDETKQLISKNLYRVAPMAIAYVCIIHAT